MKRVFYTKYVVRLCTPQPIQQFNREVTKISTYGANKVAEEHIQKKKYNLFHPLGSFFCSLFDRAVDAGANPVSHSFFWLCEYHWKLWTDKIFPLLGARDIYTLASVCTTTACLISHQRIRRLDFIQSYLSGVERESSIKQILEDVSTKNQKLVEEVVLDARVRNGGPEKILHEKCKNDLEILYEGLLLHPMVGRTITTLHFANVWFTKKEDVEIVPHLLKKIPNLEKLIFSGTIKTNLDLSECTSVKKIVFNGAVEIPVTFPKAGNQLRDVSFFWLYYPLC